MSVAIFRPVEVAAVEILLPMMKELHASEGLEFDPQQTRAAVVGLLENPAHGRLWFIEWDGTRAGYVALTFGYSLERGGRDACLDELYIRPEFRGKHLGTQAVAFVLDYCRQEGFSGIFLEVRPENAPAQSVYRKAGFVVRPFQLMTLEF